MKKLFRLTFLVLIFMGTYTLIAQQKDIPIGDWRCHLDYSDATSVAETGDTLFCGTSTGMFMFIRSWGGIIPLSRKDNLYDVHIRKLRYSKKYHQLFIAYDNTVIDVWENYNVFHISDIYNNKNILGVKQINNMDFFGKYCYISTSFGIVKYDVEKKEVTDTYMEIGPPNSNFTGLQVAVNDVALTKDSIYAATSKGLLSAPLSKSQFLADYHFWHLSSQVPCSVADTFNGKLWVGFKGGGLKYFDGKEWKIFPTGGNSTQSGMISYAEVDHNHLILTADSAVHSINTNMEDSLYKYNAMHNAIVNGAREVVGGVYYYSLLVGDITGKYYTLKPNGPNASTSYNITPYKDEIWVTAGGYDLHYAPKYSDRGFYLYKEGKWENKNFNSVKNYKDLRDIYDIAVDKNTGHKWVSSFGYGLMDFYNDSVHAYYTTKNSPMRVLGCDFDTCELPLKIAGLKFDANNNLWIANTFANKPLHVRTQAGKFYSFDVGASKDLLNIAVDDNNQIWATRPFTGGVMVYNHKGTLADTRDDKVKELFTGRGNGNLPDRIANCVVKDKEGQIWIGTNGGVAVVYDPSTIFTNKDFDAKYPWVENGKESGYLLAAQIVNCIAVDGGNRKWIGTKKGLWVTSPDGTKVLHYFTMENSPMPSDNVKTIGIHELTGEVFIGTDAGIVSYRTNATEPGEEFGDVYAYPNPVRPEYGGDIYIKGLIKNTNVKITDITGNVVYETTSLGGTATWNGKDFNGRKANSGVYLVFLANDDGSQSMVTKILIVR